MPNVCELYSVVLDINGHILVPPTGPTPYLGEFYEMVVNPDNKELYSDVVGCIVDSSRLFIRRLTMVIRIVVL